MAKKAKKTKKSANVAVTNEELTADTLVREEQTDDEDERKTKRLNLIIRPSIYDDAKLLADVQRISVNELIARAVTMYIAEHADALEAYKNFLKTLE